MVDKKIRLNEVKVIDLIHVCGIDVVMEYIKDRTTIKSHEDIDTRFLLSEVAESNLDSKNYHAVSTIFREHKQYCRISRDVHVRADKLNYVLLRIDKSSQRLVDNYHMNQDALDRLLNRYRVRKYINKI